MPYKLDDKKVLLAIDLIVKDVDKKYDECLVEHFLEFIGSQPKEDGWLVVIERLNSFVEHKAFVMFNQARTFKIISRLLAVSYPIQEGDFKTLLPTLNNVWNTMDMVILNKNWSALTLMMSIFDNLIVACSHGLNWLMDRSIDPPIKIQDSLINNLTSSLRYCLEVCNNYHTRNKAEELIASLIFQLQNGDLSSHHVVAIRDITKELISKNSIPMFTIIIKTLSQAKTDRIRTIEMLDLIATLEKEFSTSNKGKNLSYLIKCLALTNSEQSFQQHIDILKTRQDVDAILLYLSHSFHKNDESYRLLFIFSLYPLLATCGGEQKGELIKKLMANEDEVEMINNASISRLIPLCLSQLRQVDLNSRQSMLELVFDTFICFMNSHCDDMKNYKNIMECCHLCEVFASKFDTDDVFPAHKLISEIHKIIDKIAESDDKKPILIKLLRLPVYIQKLSKPSRFGPGVFFDIWTHNAMKFKDHDIMNELAELSRVKMYGYQPPIEVPVDLDEQKSFWKLIWQQMYLEYAKQTDHREFLGNITYLLIILDRFAPDSVLAEFKIERYVSIPIILGDILIEHWSVTPIVMRTIDALSDSANEIYWTSLPLRCLEHISNGLMSASRSELGEDVMIKACNILKRFSSICLKSDEALRKMKAHSASDEKSEFGSKIELSSLVDDILNYELISDGISDCY